MNAKPAPESLRRKACARLAKVTQGGAAASADGGLIAS